MSATPGPPATAQNGDEALFWFFTTDDERLQVLLPFCEQGLTAGEKLIVLASRSFFHSSLAEAIKAILIPGKGGRLSAHLVGGTGRGPRDLATLDELMPLLERETAQAAAEGATGVRLVMEADALLAWAAAKANTYACLEALERFAGPGGCPSRFILDASRANPAVAAAILATQARVGIGQVPAASPGVCRPQGSRPEDFTGYLLSLPALEPNEAPPGRPPIYAGTLDPQGNLLEANRAAIRLSGLEPGAAHPGVFAKLPAWDRTPETGEQLAEAVRRAARGETQTCRVEATLPGEEIVPVDLCFLPVASPDGQVDRILFDGQPAPPPAEPEPGGAAAQVHAQAIFEHISAGVLLVDAGGRVIECNPAARQVFCGRAGQGAHVSLFDLVHPQDQASLARWLQAVVTSGQSLEPTELLFHRLDGHPVWVRLDGSAFSGADGHTRYVTLVATDITRQMAASQVLNREDSLLDEILNGLPVGVWVADRSGRLVIGNRAGERMWGGARRTGESTYTEGRAWRPGQPAPLQPGEWPLDRALENGETTPQETLEIELPDGTRKLIVDSAAPIFDEDHQVVAAISVNQDITERKRIEAELAEVQRRLLVNTEKERLNLARDLHDGPIQDLYGVTYQAAELCESLAHTDLGTTAAQIFETVKAVAAELRSFCNELRPPTLAPFGLEKALRSHTENFRQNHPELEIRLDLMPDGLTLPESMRMSFFRIYQELLNNILHHAQATEVKVWFTLDKKRVTLTVQDNGQGFEVPEHWVELVRAGHLGLVGIQERAEAMSGKVQVTSAPGQGTTIRVSAARPVEPATGEIGPQVAMHSHDKNR